MTAFEQHWHSPRPDHRGDLELVDESGVVCAVVSARAWSCERCGLTRGGYAGPADAWLAFLAHEPLCAWRMVEKADLDRTMRELAELEARLIARDVVRRGAA